MHIIMMLVLVILGYAAGENISWWIGAPMIALGLYCFDLGGKKLFNFRFDQESLFTLIGLFSMVGVILGLAFGL